MTDKLTLAEIEQQLGVAEETFHKYCLSLTDEQFFHQPGEKWSPAQQVRHLIISADKTKLAFSLPKFILRWYAGKPNRPSRTYDELVAKYKLKLEQGGRASKAFIPKPIPADYGKEKMLGQFKIAMDKLSGTIRKKWKDPQLDQYLAPHPLLGKITSRELGYFTIHHTYHHLESIQKQVVNSK
ncbi:MAG: DinB family protein [Chitinophagaceae bacterium]|nr:DinB family protein [Chitinophagaceae bacterium]